MNLDAFFPNKDWDIFESCFEKWFLREFTLERYRVELHTFLAFYGDSELDFVEESLKEAENYCSYLSRVYHDEKLHESFHKINKLIEHPYIEIKSKSDIKPIIGNWWGNGEHTKTDLKIQLSRLKPIISNNEIAKKKSLVRGKQLNLADKYHLANEVFGIDKTLRKLDHLSDTEKHILLSQILGCNQQTARELYNGTIYKRTQIQENIVIPYLKKIKGE